MATAWHAPDPVTLAHPLTDLTDLLGAIRASGRRAAVVTSDDRAPTERTLAHLGLDDLLDAVVCADDGLPTKPAPDAVTHVCVALSTRPGPGRRRRRFARGPRDGPPAGAGLVIGVRTGVGPMPIWRTRTS